MCLSIPAKIISIEGSYAEVSIGGSVFKASIEMVPGVQKDDYILLHAGFAIQKIDEEEALLTLKLLDEMNKNK